MKYTKSHEWVDFIEEKKVRIGLSAHAVHQLGELVFVNLPEVDDELEAGESFGDAESIKAVSDIYSPVSGRVSAVNEEVLDNPALVNEAPESTWLIEVEEVSENEELLDEAEYKSFCESEA
ncbi:MAG: glycine cleavage system protein GcvH [Eubacteriales bacterium]|nr:glycine cleavage system protein GcvH [Eubacteriales bacterium]